MVLRTLEYKFKSYIPCPLYNITIDNCMIKILRKTNLIKIIKFFIYIFIINLKLEIRWIINSLYIKFIIPNLICIYIISYKISNK